MGTKKPQPKTSDPKVEAFYEEYTKTRTKAPASEKEEERPLVEVRIGIYTAHHAAWASVADAFAAVVQKRAQKEE